MNSQKKNELFKLLDVYEFNKNEQIIWTIMTE